jgi:Chaperone of endosialidase
MKTIKNIIYPAFALFAFACFALSPTAQATPDPGSVGGVFNTADGFNAMPFMSAGTANSAFGAFALFSAVSPNFNTAVGAGTLFFNTTGIGNTAVGAGALLVNVNGTGNTAVGAQALFSNTGGQFDTDGVLNTAVGVGALFSNTTGTGNTAVGAGPGESGNPDVGFVPGALGSNTIGRNNTAVGGSGANGLPGALGSNIDGFRNTAIGANALSQNTSGSGNIAVGAQAGESLTTGSDNIDIGNSGVADEAKTIRIGDDQTSTFIAGISGTAMPGGTGVVIDTTNGHLGVKPSSKRFKEQIKPMDKASEALLALKPVSFRYKKEIDPVGTSQFGLVAEDVEKVKPDLVVRDKEGKPYTVRYDAVNAMLLNEFLKEHREVQELKKQVAALTAGLQKVSAQLELNKPASQTVANSQ